MTRSNILILTFSLVIICIISSSIIGFSSSIKHFDWKSVSLILKDSVIFMDNYGRIPNSIQGVDAKRPKEYDTVIWIIEKASINDLENLLYNHESGTIKGIAAKGLLRKNKSQLLKYLKYTISQEINVSYYDWCQQLGGYFLEEITANIPENLSLYFTEEEINEIEPLIKGKDFNCKW